MTKEQVTILILAYIALGLVVYFVLNYFVVEKKYHKFYALPVIPLYYSLKEDPKFNKIETCILLIIYGIVYVPLSPIWFLSWALLKVGEYLGSDGFEEKDQPENPSEAKVFKLSSTPETNNEEIKPDSIPITPIENDTYEVDESLLKEEVESNVDSNIEEKEEEEVPPIVDKIDDNTSTTTDIEGEIDAITSTVNIEKEATVGLTEEPSKMKEEKEVSAEEIKDVAKEISSIPTTDNVDEDIVKIESPVKKSTTVKNSASTSNKNNSNKNKKSSNTNKGNGGAKKNYSSTSNSKGSKNSSNKPKSTNTHNSAASEK